MDPTACVIMDDDLLDFSLDGEDEDDDKTKAPSSSSLEFSTLDTQDPDDYSRSFPEFAEEELEWLSNKDAFPAVETCLDILSEPPISTTNHQSPVSVLENSTSSSHSNSNSTITSCCGSFRVPVSYPVRARSKRRRRRRRGFLELPTQQCWWLNQVNVGKKELPTRPPPCPPTAAASGLGRRCQHCLAEKTPQWRAGPMGPKTLCNACGVRYKSGRLVPEYRPASSPTFSSTLHSNSHRKVVEMRKHKQLAGGMMVNEACGCGAG